MLVNFNTWPNYSRLALRSEDISRIEESSFHAVIVMKSGERIDVLESFRDANERLNKAVLTEGTEIGAEKAIENRNKEIRMKKLYDKVSNRLNNNHRI